VLSDRNPWFCNGTAASGVGGPHIGLGHVWPMALITQGWTATTDAEVAQMLSTLVNTSACSGLIHESFNKVCQHLVCVCACSLVGNVGCQEGFGLTTG
jgi:meiotically up-regulated gene 157 (Mug157) protein